MDYPTGDSMKQPSSCLERTSGTEGCHLETISRVRSSPLQGEKIDSEGNAAAGGRVQDLATAAGPRPD